MVVVIACDSCRAVAHGTAQLLFHFHLHACFGVRDSISVDVFQRSPRMPTVVLGSPVSSSSTSLLEITTV